MVTRASLNPRRRARPGGTPSGLGVTTVELLPVHQNVPEAFLVGRGGYDKMSAFLDMVAQDPVVSRAKLVAEPWDVGQMDSYDLGRFPPLWREWNPRPVAPPA
jgi:pullulanase/glycogen debranching enzyme